MENPKSGQGSVGHSMLDVLDRTLLNHLERITGTREGILGLPMDLVTVACIVLMAERAANPEDLRGRERYYSQLEFQQELAEMGLADDQRLQGTLDSMVGKGYLEIDPQGGVKPGKPAISMARLLDHAFPGMPGMNLVAYFVQTLDEVESGRKGAKDATMQLDQMLRRHGAASFRRASKGARPGTILSTRKTAKPAPNIPSRPQRPTRLRIPDEMRFPAPETPSPPEKSLTDAAPTLEEEGLTSETGVFNNDFSRRMETLGLTEHAAEEESPASDLPEIHEETGGMEAVPGIETSASDLPSEEKTDDITLPPKGKTELEDYESPPELSLEREGETAVHEQEKQPQNIEPDPETLPSGPEGGEATPTGPEDSIDERVAAFEEELAMQCPVCRKAPIEARETAKGRIYYKCADEKCMFISWGRPHHVVCPLCGNPFLVESSSGEGPTILKCPRATCRYRGDSSGDQGKAVFAGKNSDRPSPAAGKPRRRVVRRKVLRKKR